MSLKAIVKRNVPPRLLLTMRTLAYRGVDMLDTLRHGRDPLVPPKHLMYDAATSDTRTFRENSREFLNYYIELAGLQPYESILDVGSGVGRKTIALTGYLDERGRYEGLEIVKKAVDWCTEAITSRYPNFRFTHINIHNEFYNPTGRGSAAEYIFPFPDQTFDLVVLGSVFTHMRPPEIAHYFGEISRVMKRGGRSFITYFLLNDQARRLIAEGKSTLDFSHDFGDFLSTSRRQPEVAICLPEDLVRRLYRSNRLAVREPIRYGSWCGRAAHLSYQDIVIAEKPLVDEPARNDRA